MSLHRVLIVGVGSIGERHLRCFAATGRAELSLCETNPAPRQAIAERYGVAAFDDYEAALESNPGIVVICTPAHLHIAMAQRAVKRGCAVLIEKPLSTSMAGVDDLIRLIDERKVVAGVAYVYRAHPALQAMRRELQSGRFGRPVQIISQSGQHFPFYRPAYREIYYKNRATGGGAVQDALTHVMNAGEWLVGPVDQLAADLDHKILPGVGVEDTVHVITRHGPVMGCFNLNQHQAPNEMMITVVCTRGTVRFEVHNCRWRWCTEPGSNWNDEPGPALERDSWFIAQAAAFLDAVEGKTPVLCTVAEGRQTLAVNLAVLQAAERKHWQKVSVP